MKYTSPATLALAALILSSCGSSLESESGLYDVELKHSIKVPIDGWWSWGKGPAFKDKKSGYVYIAPLDISLVKDDEPELSALLVPQMHDYMIAYLTRVLDEANKENHTRWKITTDPSKADFRMNMAVVSLRPQRPVLRWIFFVGSFFSPIPGTGTIAGKFTNGDICIEFTIRNNRTGELLYAMKDSNRATTRLYKAEAYHRDGQADKNLQIWAQKIARLVRFYTSSKYSHQDISDVIDNTSVIRALFYRIETDVEDETMSSQNAPELEGPTEPTAPNAGAGSSASSQNAPELEGPTQAAETEGEASSKSSEKSKRSRAESKPADAKAVDSSSAASQNAPELEGPTKPADQNAGEGSSAGSQNAPEIEGPTKPAAEAEVTESSTPRRSRRARTSETSEAKATDNTESPGKAAAPEAKSPAPAESAAKAADPEAKSPDPAEAATKPEPAAQPAPKPEPAGEAKPEAPAASAAPEPAKPAASTDSPAKQA